MRFLLVLLILFPSVSFADSLYLGAWSKHFDDKSYNETHNLIAYERKGWMVGYFKNSFSDDTYFISKKTAIRTYKRVVIGVNTGVMHGYDKKDWDFLNVGGTTLMLNFYLEPRYKYAPVLMNLGNALAISPRVRFE